ncbi:pancreatic eIF-2alpha kinase isoform X2 [Lycorma delicatula]|uniref:pancreatic eIF-2alpha kinase isoform X2 n=1 Tax=Lycorma delicatula TaxID=130591 RepID=UPI003F5173F9
MTIMRNYLFNCFFIFVYMTFTVTCTSDENDERIDGLPFCGPAHYSHYKSKKLVFVSTLDGHVSMLNIANGGVKEWSVPTGPGPMLSSNIHNRELTNNGQWVRMIPSLSGGLYKFNGEFIEAIPINAEHLLKSSFRYSDDLVISGGKESRTYGVEVESGRVLYECTMNNCENMTEDEVDNVGDVVLIQRLTQTVRAVEPRTGTERWNFSVAQHDVKFSPDPTADCHIVSDPLSEVILKVIVPEGLICALSKSQPGKVLWTHKFESPVVNAWRLDKGQLELVDLFGGKTPALPYSPPEGDDDNEYDDDYDDIMPDSPALYVGMHKKQLYIQESVTMQTLLHKVATQYKHHLIGPDKAFPRIPWQPVSASALVLGGVGKKKSELKKVLQITDESSSSSSSSSSSTSLSSSNDLAVTATSVLYGSEYINGNGYYLYTADAVENSKTGLCHPSKDKNITINGTVDDDNNILDGDNKFHDFDDEEEDDTPVQVIIVSLWYWWKEVFVISISTAIVVNLLLQRRPIFQSPSKELILYGKTALAITEGDSGVDLTRGYSRTSSKESDYVSRYLTDFDQVHCLGKGGFGIVFEAKNKIDDCHYAVKRIPLPNRQESRERVMREVKALAKLDHKNIVRYFNAWLECPPPGWQEAQDKLWDDRSIEFVDPTSVISTGHLTKGADNQISCSSQSSPFPANNVNGYSFVDPLQHSYNDNDSFQIVFENSNKSHNDNDGEEVVNDNEKYHDDNITSGKICDNKDCAILNVEDNSYKDSVILIGPSTASNTTITTSFSDNNNYNEENGDNIKNRKSKQSHNFKRHKRPNSLSLRKSEIDSFKQKSDCCSSRMFLFIQMQLCRKDSLREWLECNKRQRQSKQVLSIFEQIIGAVEYVHLQGLIHRDLKPSNIFFSLDGQIKVGDFGLVTAMVENGDTAWSPQDTTPDSNNKSFGTKNNEKHTARVGTHLYMSPEQVEGKLYNYKVDIYSLGLILFELLVPFDTSMERQRTLGNLRKNIFPTDFQNNFKNEIEAE